MNHLGVHVLLVVGIFWLLYTRHGMCGVARQVPLEFAFRNGIKKRHLDITGLCCLSFNTRLPLVPSDLPHCFWATFSLGLISIL